MGGYILRSTAAEVSLPAQRVDRLIARGDGDAALLYLFLSRTDGAVTPEQVTERLRWTQDRFDRAEQTLQQLGLLEGGRAPVEPAEERPVYTADDLSGMLEQDSSFSALVEQSEQKLGKRLKTADLQILAGLYDDLRLPPDVIYLLINYCIDRIERRFGPGRRPTLRQIEKEGYYWARLGLFDQKQAAQYLNEQSRKHSQTAAYLRVLQISGRAAVDSEERYIGEWIEKGYSPELVALAYDQTILYKKELKWGYLNAILRRWEENGWRTPEQVKNGSGRGAPRARANGAAGKNDWMKQYIAQKK
ncbi:MAG: DnaD domain protein [Oscillospiraceae bacterium]|nr:DnaD domain protein [Oscillospiraceae bacterium]